ncbi:MAG: protein-L-isoaspartate(D-aspartate) O-methyltransferase [Myxococcota bacterium]
MSTGSGFEVERAGMVARIARSGRVGPRVLEALQRVPRHEFVPPHLAAVAYEDRPLPVGEGQTVSQPLIVALMTEALTLSASDRVLEIGSGSGYAAAVLAEIAGEVYTTERLPRLARSAKERLKRLGYAHVHVSCRDGTLGWPEHAPFDAISVACGAPEIPAALREQLGCGGRLVIPVGRSPTMQTLVRAVRLPEGELRCEELDDVCFVPLIGAQGWPETPEPGSGRRIEP